MIAYVLGPIFYCSLLHFCLFYTKNDIQIQVRTTTIIDWDPVYLSRWFIEKIQFSLFAWYIPVLGLVVGVVIVVVEGVKSSLPVQYNISCPSANARYMLNSYTCSWVISIAIRSGIFALNVKFSSLYEITSDAAQLSPVCQLRRAAKKIFYIIDKIVANHNMSSTKVTCWLNFVWLLFYPSE